MTLIKILSLCSLTIMTTGCVDANNSTYNLNPLPQIEVPTTSSASSCHPSYSGCLNVNASDYDCSGGTGNGPYYTGMAQVIGPDVFDLDRDNDGLGCE